MRVCFFLTLGTAACAMAAVECACDHAAPATLQARECSLCQEADRHAAGAQGSVPVFYLKDSSPRKPNRTLILPVRHSKGQQDLRQLSSEERRRFWQAAMAKAEELFPGGAWGLAINSESVRTQCHLHLHIGRLNEGLDESSGRLVAGPAQIPLPEAGLGIWLHPVPGGLHLHTDREIAEPVLVR